MSYGYQQGEATYSGVNYNNEYQIRDPTTANYYANAAGTTAGTAGMTSVSSLTAEPMASVETVPTALTQPRTITTTTTTTGGYDFRVPEGYRIDEFGMIVPA